MQSDLLSRRIVDIICICYLFLFLIYLLHDIWFVSPDLVLLLFQVVSAFTSLESLVTLSSSTIVYCTSNTLSTLLSCVFFKNSLYLAVVLCIYYYYYYLCAVSLSLLRGGFTAARLLGLWVRIPPRAWMSVCCDCCVLSGRGLCDELVTRPEESYRVWCV
jgi:hypothetical protein